MTHDAYDRARGTTRGFLDYFEPVFKVIGITATILAAAMAAWLLLIILSRS